MTKKKYKVSKLSSGCSDSITASVPGYTRMPIETFLLSVDRISALEVEVSSANIKLNLLRDEMMTLLTSILGVLVITGVLVIILAIYKMIF